MGKSDYWYLLESSYTKTIEKYGWKKNRKNLKAMFFYPADISVVIFPIEHANQTKKTMNKYLHLPFNMHSPKYY